MVYGEITWMFVVGIVLAIMVGYGLGANDVANTFAPSVGAKALTMKQALLVAMVFEFIGAVLLGSNVTSTIRNGITNFKYFEDTPEILAYGMLCALLATSIWMLLATYYGLPVSSTQSIVSSIAGMTIVAEGWNAVVWSKEKSTFPYLDGMSAIALSWLFAPILAGGFAAILFFLIRAFILRSSNAYQRSLVVLPLFTLVTFYVIPFFIMERGISKKEWKNVTYAEKAWISAIVAGVATLISIVVGIPLLRRKVARDLEQEAEAATGRSSPSKAISEADKTASEQSDEESGVAAQAEEGAGRTPARLATLRESRMWKALTKGVEYDIHAVTETNQQVADMHASVELFDHKAETSFKYLQVCTACANSFAHGSNEVANAIGPLAAIYQVWQDTALSKDADVPYWLLAIGGFGIVFGLATFGYKVMESMGVKITRLTNSRGFCVELCVAAVIILASRFGLPMSSTPATVGAITAVGMFEGRSGCNFRLFAKFAVFWVITSVVTILLACAFTAQGLYSPNKNCSNQRADVGAYLNATAVQIAPLLNDATAVQTIEANTIAPGMPVTSLWPGLDAQSTALCAVNGSSVACGY